METVSFCYETVKLNSVARKLCTTHHNHYELMQSCVPDNDLLSEVACMERDSGLWARLTTAQVDSLFYCLKVIKDKELLDKVLWILEKRIGKRHIKVVWILLQYDYKDPAYLAAANLVYDFMRKKYSDECSKYLIENIEYKHLNLMERALQLLRASKGSINDFIMKWDIAKFTPFYWEMCIKYLSNCEKEKLKINNTNLMELLSNMDYQNLTEVAENYLSRLDVHEYQKEICNLIRDKFEETGGYKWEGVPHEAAAKFERWLGLKAIESFFGNGNKTWDFWYRCRNSILSVYRESDTDSIYIYTDKYIAFSCLYENYLIRKKVFSVLYEAYKLRKEKDSSAKFSDVIQNYITAKEALLEGKISGVYKIDYENIGKLYIREFLEMSVADEYELFNRIRQ